MSGKVAESVSKLESAVNDKNQDKDKITAAHDEVSKLLKTPDDIKEFNKAISDNNNDIKAFKGLSLVKIEENGSMTFSADGKTVALNKDSFTTNSENKTEANKAKGVDFKIDENTGRSTYAISKGDTIWGVAERICAERNPDKKASALDVYKEMSNIIKENPQLASPDRIKEGRDTLTLPKDTIESVLAARKAAEEKKANETKNQNTTTENQTPPSKTNEQTPPSTTENQTAPNNTSNLVQTTTADCNTPQVGPEQRTAFLVQEQGWLLSKGQKKETVFDDIDLDGDSYLTTTEINRYRVENTIDKNKNHDAYLNELVQKRSDVENANDDETWSWYDNDGIRKTDIMAWTDGQTVADKRAKEVEQKKVEQDNKKAEEQKANEDAKVLLQDQKFFLKVSDYDGKISIPDVDKYRKELADKQPASEEEKLQIEREKKALAQIRGELLRRSTSRVRPKTDEYVNDENGVMTQDDSQQWKV